MPNALSIGLGDQAVGRLASAQRKQTSRSCQADDTNIRRLIAVNENQGVKECNFCTAIRLAPTVWCVVLGAAAMLGSVAGYFFSVITVFVTVMTFMTLLIGVFDNSTSEKLRHYQHPRPIIERSAPAPPILEPHRLGTNDARASQH